MSPIGCKNKFNPASSHNAMVVKWVGPDTLYTTVFVSLDPPPHICHKCTYFTCQNHCLFWCYHHYHLLHLTSLQHLPQCPCHLFCHHHCDHHHHHPHNHHHHPHNPQNHHHHSHCHHHLHHHHHQWLWAGLRADVMHRKPFVHLIGQTI